jgi:tRNA threonylcarbamoyladenosine biosynthesis protein TsaE
MTIDHPAILETRKTRWPTEADCARFAQTLATKPALRDACVELRGPLGAGKTTFVRNLLRALGIEGRIKSPTYTVLEPYQGRGFNISHFDFYRFEDPHEWHDAGFRDVFASPGLKLLEWPEKAGPALPMPDLRMHIEPEMQGECRQVRIEALTPRGQELIN